VRRGTGYFLLTLGLIAVFLAPLARFYIVPRVKKVPSDFYFREVSDGTGIYLNPAQNFAEVGPVPVRNVTIQKGDVDASTKTVAVWDQFTSLFDVENHHEITYDIDRLTLEKTTAASVNCCGQNERRTGGLTALFPIGTSKDKRYLFWDDNALKLYPMTYQATETIDGLESYRFHQAVAPLQINHLKLPGTLIGEPKAGSSVDLSWWYQGTTDVWVEPVTGGIVKASQVADQWLEDPEGKRVLTVAKIEAGWNPQTVQSAVDTASSQRKQLQLLQNTVPLAAPVAGIVLIVVGLILLGVARPRSTAEVRDAAPVAVG
jgi:hypothetical protein